MNKTYRIFFLIVFLLFFSLLIVIPKNTPLSITFANKNYYLKEIPALEVTFLGRRFTTDIPLKLGLDIQGGMQVVLKADISQIPPEDVDRALESARSIILSRVDMYGISEPQVTTSRLGDERRIIVELPGLEDSDQALQLIGTTAQLSFKLVDNNLLLNPELATDSATFQNSFIETGLTGKQLKRAIPGINPQTGESVVSIEFDGEGTKLFGDITQNHTGEMLAIFIDDIPITTPIIQTPILTGQAEISGSFTRESAQNLSIQLNAGALPLPIEILEQRQIGASLGKQSVADSIFAGLIGVSFVMLFMAIYYGYKGIIASIALTFYAFFTIAIYKIMGVTLTLPGLAGMLLSIGMAVDANILIFERMKEELRIGREFHQALELGFGRAWDSIKDANLATIMTALVLINPLDFRFLNTSGLVRGFGITLLVGVLISLFTGVVVTRTMMRLFLSAQAKKIEGSR